MFLKIHIIHSQNPIIIYRVLWKSSPEGPLQRNSGLTDWLKTRNWTSTPNFKLQAPACACQCVSTWCLKEHKANPGQSTGAEGKQKVIGISSTRFPQEPRVIQQLSCPGKTQHWRRDESVMIGGKGATWTAEEEGSVFSLFPIFTEAGPHSINPSAWEGDRKRYRRKNEEYERREM